MNKESKEWLEETAKNSKETIEKCDIFASVVTKSFVDDPKCALQIGYAVLMDKPIILIVDKTVAISASLVKVAKLIERVDITSDIDMQRAMQSIKDFSARMK